MIVAREAPSAEDTSPSRAILKLEVNEGEVLAKAELTQELSYGAIPTIMPTIMSETLNQIAREVTRTSSEILAPAPTPSEAPPLDQPALIRIEASGISLNRI